jgi:hypothetical protein
MDKIESNQCPRSSSASLLFIIPILFAAVLSASFLKAHFLLKQVAGGSLLARLDESLFKTNVVLFLLAFLISILSVRHCAFASRADGRKTFPEAILPESNEAP